VGHAPMRRLIQAPVAEKDDADREDRRGSGTERGYGAGWRRHGSPPIVELRWRSFSIHFVPAPASAIAHSGRAGLTRFIRLQVSMGDAQQRQSVLAVLCVAAARDQ